MGTNRWRSLHFILALVVGAAVFSSAPSAQANDMDPVLSRMWLIENNRLTTRDDLMDALALDLAQAMAPNFHHPAETLGWSGFFMGLEATLTFIDSNALHWRCGIENTGGGHGGNGACDTWDVADGAIFVPAVHVRKGLPYSIELGFQVQYMANSELVGIGGEIRWAPFEGYREGWSGYLPDISFSFTGSYLMGSSELVLGMLGWDASVSYPFTISGQMTITPYFGYQGFIVGSDQEQVFNSAYLENPQGFLDTTCDGVTGCERYLSFHGGLSRNFGQDIAALKFHRILIGARFLWENLAVTPQFGLTVPWESGSAVGTSADKVHFQMSLSLGSDF